MAFITKSNAKKIISKIDKNRLGIQKCEIYKNPIYFFSQYENNYLLGMKTLFSDPELFIEEYYVPIKNEDTLRYVYEGGKPAYHDCIKCKRLNSDFRNFLIPIEIRKRGKEEVDKFRHWFESNTDLLDKPDVFTARLHMAFNVVVSPKEINRKNSGVEYKENLNLEELEKRINKHISEVGEYYKKANQEKKEVIRRFEKKTFLAYKEEAIRNNDTRYSDDAIKGFLKKYDEQFKKPVTELLIEYYKVKYNPELKFEGYLLEMLGFKACSTCHH